MKNVSKFRKWLIEKLGGHVEQWVYTEPIVVERNNIKAVFSEVRISDREVLGYPIEMRAAMLERTKLQLSEGLAHQIRVNNLWKLQHQTDDRTGGEIVRATIHIATYE